MRKSRTTPAGHARSIINRVLQYLELQERRCCWSGTAVDADNLRLAWWTVRLASRSQASADPYDAALRRVLGPRYRHYMATHNTLPLFLPEAEAIAVGELDGRTGLQWVRSALAYLEWRSGASWRPLAHRWLPERKDYTDAILTINMAFFGTNPPGRRVSSEKARRQSAAA